MALFLNVDNRYGTLRAGILGAFLQCRRYRRLADIRLPIVGHKKYIRADSGTKSAADTAAAVNRSFHNAILLCFFLSMGGFAKNIKKFFAMEKHNQTGHLLPVLIEI